MATFAMAREQERRSVHEKGGRQTKPRRTAKSKEQEEKSLRGGNRRVRGPRRIRDGVELYLDECSHCSGRHLPEGANTFYCDIPLPRVY